MPLLEVWPGAPVVTACASMVAGALLPSLPRTWGWWALPLCHRLGLPWEWVGLRSPALTPCLGLSGLGMPPLWMGSREAGAVGQPCTWRDRAAGPAAQFLWLQAADEARRLEVCVPPPWCHWVPGAVGLGPRAGDPWLHALRQLCPQLHLCVFQSAYL